MVGGLHTIRDFASLARWWQSTRVEAPCVHHFFPPYRHVHREGGPFLKKSAHSGSTWLSLGKDFARRYESFRPNS